MSPTRRESNVFLWQLFCNDSLGSRFVICHKERLIKLDCMRCCPPSNFHFSFLCSLCDKWFKVFFCLRINYDVACPMDFRKYPYDTQTCKVKYESCKFWQKNLHSDFEFFCPNANMVYQSATFSISRLKRINVFFAVEKKVELYTFISTSSSKTFST